MADPLLTDQRRREIETRMAEWLSENRIPGAALAIVDGDELAYAEGFGARTLETNEPATADTLFGVGSATKSFTAAAVMQLVEQGRLDPSDPVDRYIPHLSDAPGDPITIHDLLAHTSGMPDDSLAPVLMSRQLGMGHIEVPLSGAADFRRHIRHSLQRRVTAPDTFFYFNSGYTMLGQIVEEVSGRSYADYVAEHVLGPLGMARSTFDSATFHADEDRMTPYIKQESSVPSAFPFDPLIYPAGGLLSSVTEMANYLRLLLGGGEVNGERVLSSESVEAMTTPSSTFGAYYDGTLSRYGYGHIVESVLGDRLIGHGGSVLVATAWFGYLADAGIGAVIACNTTPATHPSLVGPAILARLQEADPTEALPAHRLSAALDRVTGDYAGYRDLVGATVDRDGDMLRAELRTGLGNMALHLLPERVEADRLTATTMMGMGMTSEVHFEFSDDGVEMFAMHNRLTKA
jgi:CubicO group peptidase (beta-lactamase class C family)